MKTRIAPRTPTRKIHQGLMSDLNNFCVDLKLAIQDGTGVPATKSKLNRLTGLIIEALEGEQNPGASFCKREWTIREGDYQSRNSQKTKDFFDTLKKALEDYARVPFSNEQIDKYCFPTYNELGEYQEQLVKY